MKLHERCAVIGLGILIVCGIDGMLPGEPLPIELIACAVIFALGLLIIGSIGFAAEEVER